MAVISLVIEAIGSHRVAVLVDHHLAGRRVDHQRRRGAQHDLLRFAGLREADGEREDEDEGEHGDDSLERMKLCFALRQFP